MGKYAYLFAARLGGIKRETAKKKEKRNGKTREMPISREAVGEEDGSFYEVLRYRWNGGPHLAVMRVIMCCRAN